MRSASRMVSDRRLDAFDNLPDLGDRLLDALAPTQGQAQADGCATDHRYSQTRSPMPASPIRGAWIGLHRLAQAHDFGQSAGDQGRPRVVAQLQAIGHAARHGQDDS